MIFKLFYSLFWYIALQRFKIHFLKVSVCLAALGFSFFLIINLNSCYTAILFTIVCVALIYEFKLECIFKNNRLQFCSVDRFLTKCHLKCKRCYKNWSHLILSYIDLADRLERLAVDGKIATVLGRSQHPPTEWNLSGGRWSSVE